MQYLYLFLNRMMSGCYGIVHHYGWAIVLFTVLSKILLLPVSWMTYCNSVKMARMQPARNRLRAAYYGQKDRIAEEEAKLYRKQGYHPLLSVIPLFIQLALLVGVIEVIRQGMADPAIDMSLGPIDLGMIPAHSGMRLAWSPLAAGVSSWILCSVQNAQNVLQAGQSAAGRSFTMLFSVGLSLYLGWYAAVGTVLYWICSNLLTVVQLYLMNAVVRPKRYIDQKELQTSREELDSLQKAGRQGQVSFRQRMQQKKRERRDYHRFFSVVNKHLVFYSERSGYYKYLKGYMAYLLEHTNLTIHYITSDPFDPIFELEKTTDGLRAYYIGENRLITLMMRMDADVVVMTMPDLEQYHIKRSRVRGDIEYIYVQHDMNSHSMLMRKGCMDYFDTVFCAGPHQLQEIREEEALYGLPGKRLVQVGYPLIDEIRAEVQSRKGHTNARKKILIAPSWQEDNLIDSCLETVLDQLGTGDYEIAVRPHPQEVRLKRAYMEELRQKYQGRQIEIQMDFASDHPLLEADLLITDWSGICWEYAFTTYRPVLFIDTPMKVMNADYKKIQTPPIHLLLRDQIGKRLKPQQLETCLCGAVEDLLAHAGDYEVQNRRLAETYLYHPGDAAKTGALDIAQRIQKKIAERKTAGEEDCGRENRKEEAK